MVAQVKSQFDTDAPILSALDSIDKWPSAESRTWAYQEIPLLCGQPNVKAIVFFGSIVRNVSLSADLDVLCIYEGTAPCFSTLPIDVDLRKYEQREVEKLLANGNDLLSWCIKFGKPVCEHDRYWCNLLERWANGIKLPSSKVALERARKSERLLREMDSVGDFDAALEIYLSLLTHIARATLIRRDIYPTSRPELSGLLTQIGEKKLASYLQEAINTRNAFVHGVSSIRKKIWQPFLAELSSAKRAEALTAHSDEDESL